jgi:hypothetical protein
MLAVATGAANVRAGATLTPNTEVRKSLPTQCAPSYGPATGQRPCWVSRGCGCGDRG